MNNMFNDDWNPYDVLMELVNRNNQTQNTLKQIDVNIQEIAKAHNDLRIQTLELAVKMKELKEQLDEISTKK